MSLHATSETAIFERLVLASQPDFSEEAARSILAIQLSPEDLQRAQLLADKVKLGSLSSDEEQWLESYERVGHYPAILQSKARVTLKSTAPQP